MAALVASTASVQKVFNSPSRSSPATTASSWPRPPEPWDRCALQPDRTRCWWADYDPLLAEYHDDEWGRPVTDDRQLFEMLSLEAFQAGLSWLTILRKRDAFRKAFHGFEPAAVARFDDADHERLMSDAGIVRNREKIHATVGNASAMIELIRVEGSFRHYLLERVPRPARRLPQDMKVDDLAATTPESDALSKDLKKRGFRFIGPTIVYSFMEAVGLVDDHMPYCFRYVAP